MRQKIPVVRFMSVIQIFACHTAKLAFKLGWCLCLGVRGDFRESPLCNLIGCGKGKAKSPTFTALRRACLL
jgi:hypothetical protein